MGIKGKNFSRSKMFKQPDEEARKKIREMFRKYFETKVYTCK